MKRDSFILGALAALVCLNYFAFRVELFGDEYKENHPPLTSSPSITRPSLTWETFDKDNAPQALSLAPCLQVGFLSYAEKPFAEVVTGWHVSHPVRDKSPPIVLLFV